MIFLPYNKALRIIKDAAALRTTELKLSEMRLTSLPPEIAQLKNLRSLDLSKNLLTLLPPEIAQVANETRWPRGQPIHLRAGWNPTASESGNA